MEMFIVPDGMTVTQEQTKWLLVRLETFNFFSGKLWESMTLQKQSILSLPNKKLCKFLVLRWICQNKCIFALLYNYFLKLTLGNKFWNNKM